MRISNVNQLQLQRLVCCQNRFANIVGSTGKLSDNTIFLIRNRNGIQTAFVALMGFDRGGDQGIARKDRTKKIDSNLSNTSSPKMKVLANTLK